MSGTGDRLAKSSRASRPPTPEDDARRHEEKLELRVQQEMAAAEAAWLAEQRTTFRDLVRKIAGRRQTSVERVINEAWDPNVKGTAPATIKKAMRGERPLQPVIIEAVAGALEVPPDTFAEYRLALARRLFDEREIGLDAALANLSRLDAALAAAGDAVLAHAAEPEEHRTPHSTPVQPVGQERGRGR